MLAITFTRKATAEMRDRIARQLAQAHAGTPPANAFDESVRPFAVAVLLKDAALGWDLLGQPRRLNLRTIDSVCADISRGLPVLSGSGGAVTPVEDAAAFYDQAARRTLALLGGDDPIFQSALESLLLHRDGNLRECEQLIARMLATRDHWGELVPLSDSELDDAFLDGEVLPRLDRALDLAICRSLTRLRQIVPAPILAQLAELAAEMAHSEGCGGDPSPIALCAARSMPPEERTEHLDHWRALIGLLLTQSGDYRAPRGIHKGTLAFLVEPHHKAELIEIIDELRPDGALRDALRRVRALPPAEYPRDQWPLAKSLFRVLSRALVELQFVFAAAGQSDFIETALQARSALSRPGSLDDLRLSRTLALQHLLVDEMQDTSSAQYELIRLLTEHWDGRSQTLFLVGDPKQSIYLFRQARVERFVATMHQQALGDVALEPLLLTANFRSQRPLVDSLNETFSLLFPAESDPTAPELVPFHAATAARTASAKRGSATQEAQHWHLSAFPYTADRALCADLKSSQAAADAGEIRRLILGYRAQPHPPTIAVLVRSRSHLLEIVAAFKKAPAIPFRALNIEPLAERQEVLDCLTLTRALLHPADRTAWLALLRTPWVGLTLADLHVLAGQDDHAHADTPVLELLEMRGELLSADGIARVTPFRPFITLALARRGRLPLARWVQQTWNDLGTARHATPEQLANVTRFLQLLGELDDQQATPGGQGSIDLATLTTRLKSLYAAPSLTPDCVDLLTIHGAKGLEWDVVFVPALERQSRVTSSALLSWLETDPGPLDDPGLQPASQPVAPGLLAPIRSKGGAARALNDWMRSIESAREAAERTRLVYVAATRAREHLHLFGSVVRNSRGELCPPAGSLLAAAWPAAEAHFAPDNALPELSLAAAAAPANHARLLQRIPARAAGVPAQVASQPVEVSAPQVLARPQGSYPARVFGNTLHVFLEQLTRLRAAQATVEQLQSEITAWQPRVAAVLRANGLAPALLERFTANVLRGLSQTLASAEGRWLLEPHPQAAAEQALAAHDEDGPRTLRLDRTFLAGPTPGSTGDSHLWIVDYKTATHGREGLDDFLAAEALKYAPQLETYARTLARPRTPTRLALFYPMLPRLYLLP